VVEGRKEYQVKHILIESPFRNIDPVIMQENCDYLVAAMAYVAYLGYVPIASHLIGPLFWPETDEGRARGFAMRESLADRCEEIWYFTGRGATAGMDLAKEHDFLMGRRYSKCTADLSSFYPTERSTKLLVIPRDVI
jgi:hypothetical protein